MWKEATDRDSTKSISLFNERRVRIKAARDPPSGTCQQRTMPVRLRQLADYFLLYIPTEERPPKRWDGFHIKGLVMSINFTHTWERNGKGKGKG